MYRIKFSKKSKHFVDLSAIPSEFHKKIRLIAKILKFSLIKHAKYMKFFQNYFTLNNYFLKIQSQNLYTCIKNLTLKKFFSPENVTINVNWNSFSCSLHIKSIFIFISLWFFKWISYSFSLYSITYSD